jgi:hypothetical protein
MAEVVGVILIARVIFFIMVLVSPFSQHFCFLHEVLEQINSSVLSSSRRNSFSSSGQSSL